MFISFASDQRWQRLPKTTWAQDEIADDLFELFEACFAFDNGLSLATPLASLIICDCVLTLCAGHQLLAFRICPSEKLDG